MPNYDGCRGDPLPTLLRRMGLGGPLLRPLPVLHARLRHAWLVVAALVLVGLGGCYKVATDPTSEYLPYTGQDAVTIRGVRPGQSEGDVLVLLGPPDRRLAFEYQPTSLQWQRFSDMQVTLDVTGRVDEVLGNQLNAVADAIISEGMSEADVIQVLGKPARDQSQYQPSGSGVISLGRKLVGRTLWYRRDECTIEISLRDDRVANVRLKGSRS